MIDDWESAMSRARRRSAADGRRRSVYGVRTRDGWRYYTRKANQ